MMDGIIGIRYSGRVSILAKHSETQAVRDSRAIASGIRGLYCPYSVRTLYENNHR
jgi:hypothetical protein